MFHKIEDHLDVENTKLQGGISVGIVINANDPMKLGRVQARIATLHSGNTDTQIPWVLPINTSCYGNAPGIGTLVPPPVVGTKIAIFHPSNDVTNTYYLGSMVDTSSTLATLAGSSYPNCYVHVNFAGDLIKIDSVTKTWTINLVDGTTFTFNNGNVSVVSSKGFNLKVNGDFNIDATGNVNISGTTVNLNPSSNAASSLSPTPRTAPTPQTFSNQLEY